jgi:predicted nucleotidyltransferase
MNKRELSALQKVFEKVKEVKLVYYFGSRAEGKAGPLSDYDFAAYVEAGSKKKRFEIRLELMAKISGLLKTDDVDVVILNDLENTEMSYLIIAQGRLVFEREPYKVLVEPRILHEYFDYREMLIRNKLTSAS